MYNIVENRLFNVGGVKMSYPIYDLICSTPEFEICGYRFIRECDYENKIMNLHQHQHTYTALWEGCEPEPLAKIYKDGSLILDILLLWSIWSNNCPSTGERREEVLPDWSGFADSLKMRSVFKQLKKHIDESLLSVMSEQIKDTQLTVIEEMREQLEDLHIYGQREVSLFIEEVTTKQPVISQDFLKTAIEAVINIEKSRRGEQLLSIIGKMSPDDIDKLTILLKNWDINDILTVIDEIDRRIIVIEAISRLQDDKTVDELSTLHPLVLNARWLFGSEYDSPMFVSNSALSTVLKQLFNVSEQDKEYVENLRRRPDIVVLNESTIKTVCTDRLDTESGIFKPDQILIIELKRGGFKITDKEFQQASYYTRQIRRSCVLHKKAEIHTFLVGSQIGDVDIYAKTESGIIEVVTYGQLVETASQKLFRLRERLKKHYDSLEDKSLVEQALGQYTQMKMTLDSGEGNKYLAGLDRKNAE